MTPEAIDSGLASARAEMESLKTFTQSLSEALRKIRPLGGSELFVKVGDTYFADPEYCGAAIEELRLDNYKANVKLSRLRAVVDAARKFIAKCPTGDDDVPYVHESCAGGEFIDLWDTLAAYDSTEGKQT